MGYARHIGRVGALAVTLGVGVALASTPGVAYAEPSSTSSASDSSSTSSASSATTPAGSDAASKDTSDDRDSTSESDSDDASSADSDGATDETDDEDQDADDEDAEDPNTPRRDRDSSQDSSSTRISESQDESGDEASSVTVDAAQSTESATVPSDVAVTTAAVQTADVPPAVATISSVPTPPDSQKHSAVVTVVATVESTVLPPLVEPGPVTPPVQAPVMLAALAAVRDELERNSVRRTATAAVTQAAMLVADPSPNVLVIGVDGANLSRVLADPTNANFFELIQGGTTAAASIAGHTTISNPSWSSILTGAWSEKTGVINNVFTPWTYDDWPTVFNQLEATNSAIQTTAIANWDVISAIAAAGADPADLVWNIAQVEGDTNWLLTDDAVGDATEAAIAAASAAVPNFVFSYFVGVDENGHLYGGASPEYAAALNNFDRNLGEILDAVNAWEALTGEQWTIIMVTDHGHQPQQGLGHGFQSPDETSTFVIANNPLIFTPGAINLQYEIVDVTPTVLHLFGGAPAPDSDGVSLTDLGDSNVIPVDDDEALRGALQDAIDMYGYPDIGTQLALGVRTIATSVPYFVFGLTNQLTSALQAIADQDIFLISLLAELAIIPVQFIGDIAYVATNVVAQIVAGLTGVTGASIFPLWPPAPPSFPSTPEEATMLDALLVCGDSRGAAAALWCEGAIAV